MYQSSQKVVITLCLNLSLVFEECKKRIEERGKPDYHLLDSCLRLARLLRINSEVLPLSLTLPWQRKQRSRGEPVPSPP